VRYTNNTEVISTGAQSKGDIVDKTVYVVLAPEKLRILVINVPVLVR
jgi:hypothetical protein